MCSQTPETTRPMAKPASPVTMPPKNVVHRKRPRIHPCIGRPQIRSDQRLDAGPRMNGCHLAGRLHFPRRSEYTIAAGALNAGSESFMSNTIDLAGKNAVVTGGDRKSTRLNSCHVEISYAVFCLKKKNVAYNCSS